MFSTSALPDDFLHSFDRLSVDPHIRVVPEDEDPRLEFDTTPHIFQLPPQHGHDDFPPLDSTQTSGAPKDTEKFTAYAYADVLKFSRTAFFDLYKLPPEIRELVWEASMQNDGAFTSRLQMRSQTRQNNLDTPSFLPRVCFLSKSTRDETVGVFMRNSSYLINCLGDNIFLRNFIASVPEGERNIRELFFRNFDFFQYGQTGAPITENSDLELAVHCKGLRTIHLTIGPRFIGRHVFPEDGGQSVYRLRTTAQLVAKYRLRRLLDCEKLRTVRWHGLWMTKDHEEALRGLAEWIKTEFASRGHRTEYSVTY